MIWILKLVEDCIAWTTCDGISFAGNIVSWPLPLTESTNATNVSTNDTTVDDKNGIISVRSLERYEFCKPKVIRSMILPGVHTFHEAVEACQQLNSRIFTFTDSIVNSLDIFPDNIGDCVWTGHTINPVTTEFRAHYGDQSNISSTSLVWKLGQPNGGSVEECTRFSKKGK